MRSFILILCSILLLPLIARTQDTYREREVVRTVEVLPNDYLAYRIGAWFEKDHEIGFTTFKNAQGDASRSRAYGIDFHYKRVMTRPLFFDFALGGWYTTYNFDRTLVNPDPKNIKNVDAWTVLVPVTVGVSASPLGEDIFHPYAMLGIGAYIGITGNAEETTDGTKAEETKVYAAFGGFIGAGFDFFISRTFGISVAFKYHLVKFKESELYTRQVDYTGTQIQLGCVSRL